MGFWSNLFVSFIGLFGGADELTPAQNTPLSTTTMSLMPITQARSCPVGFLGNNCQIECGLTYRGSQANSGGQPPLINKISDVMSANSSDRKISDGLNRIVGGTVAVANSWPAHVYVSIRFDGYVYLPERGITIRQQQGFACGGTLIDPQTILTAAHCLLDELNFEYKGSFYTVPVKIKPEHYSIFLGMQNKRERKRDDAVSVGQVLQHPEYSKLTVQNDIALLRLSEPVELNERVQIACLPLSSDRNNQIDNQFTDLPAWAVGWGTTTYAGSTSDQLRQVGLSVYNATMCRFVQGRKDWSKQLCAGEYNGGKDTCQGDSGGPLYTLDDKFRVGGEQEGTKENGEKKGERKFVVAGITSYGDGCAQKYSPGIYTKVSAYVDWIKSSIEEMADENNSDGRVVDEKQQQQQK